MTTKDAREREQRQTDSDRGVTTTGTGQTANERERTQGMRDREGERQWCECVVLWCVWLGTVSMTRSRENSPSGGLLHNAEQVQCNNGHV